MTSKPVRLCLMCGKRVQLLWNERAKCWLQRAGVLIRYDDDFRFCTASCAVRYAVWCAKERGK